jgi:hypothetical protein
MQASASNQSGQSDAIDAIVNARIEPQGPGVVVAVVRGGQVIHRKGYGVAQMEWGQPITPNTVFGIGSVTKPFTATAILLLDLPTPQHTPITLTPSALERMTGTHENAIRDVLEITLSDGALHVSGELTCDLIPLSTTTFVSTADPDRQVHFADEGPGGFERVTVVVPFYWYEMTRRRGG